VGILVVEVGFGTEKVSMLATARIVGEDTVGRDVMTIERTEVIVWRREAACATCHKQKQPMRAMVVLSRIAAARRDVSGDFRYSMVSGKWFSNVKNPLRMLRVFRMEWEVDGEEFKSWV
jgi:hypothetical protein